jgi:His-Xaa-Ser system protein HxsD
MSSQGMMLTVDLRLVSKDAIYKCVYWYTKEYDVGISMPSENQINLILNKRSGEQLSDEEVAALHSQIQRDLIDYNLRDIVAKETANVRDLLIAKAFSHGEFDEAPVGSVSDPVGFEVEGDIGIDDTKQDQP